MLVTGAVEQAAPDAGQPSRHTMLPAVSWYEKAYPPIPGLAGAARKFEIIASPPVDVGAQAPAAPPLLLVLLPLLLLVLLLPLPLPLVLPKPPLVLAPLLLVLVPLLLVLLPLPLLVLKPPPLLPLDEPPSSPLGNPPDDEPAHPATWTMAATAMKPTSGPAYFRRRMGVPTSFLARRATGDKRSRPGR
jgi:hypothetical protein